MITYALSAPNVKPDLIWASGQNSESVLHFKARDGSVTGRYWPCPGHVRIDGWPDTHKAELVWEGEVPKPYSLNYVSAISWIKTQMTVEEARIAETKPDPMEVFFTRIENKLDEMMDTYHRAIAQINQATGLPGPQMPNLAPELAMGDPPSRDGVMRRSQAYLVLRQLAGDIAAGDNDKVSFWQDDATGSWFIRAGEKTWFAPSLLDAIDKAAAYLDGRDKAGPHA